MSHITNTDNVYQVGTTITAKAAPHLELVIDKYYQRIYYCSIIGNDKKKILAYFERELIPPNAK